MLKRTAPTPPHSPAKRHAGSSSSTVFRTIIEAPDPEPTPLQAIVAKLASPVESSSGGSSQGIALRLQHHYFTQPMASTSTPLIISGPQIADLESLLKNASENCTITLKGFGADVDARLENLAKLPAATRARISEIDLSETQVSSTGLLHLKRLPQLQKLNVWSCKITDAEMSHLSEMMQLQSLNLGYCQGITDAGFDYLQKLVKLKTLDLTACEITESGTNALQNLMLLQELNLCLCPKTTPAGLNFLRKLTQLRKLDLSHCSVNDNTITILQEKMPQLQKLDLYNCSITENGMRLLANIPSLQELNVSFCDLNDASLQHFKTSDRQHLANLHTLNISGNDAISGSGLIHLKDLPQLQTLELYNCGIDDEGMKCFNDLTHLKSLDLDGCEKITNAGLAHLSKLVKLQRLTISQCKCTDNGLGQLAGLEQLEYLNVSGCKYISEVGIALLAHLPKLLEVVAPHCKNNSSKNDPKISLSQDEVCQLVKDLSGEELPQFSFELDDVLEVARLVNNVSNIENLEFRHKPEPYKQIEGAQEVDIPR